jgi:hypothetical protein
VSNSNQDATGSSRERQNLRPPQNLPFTSQKSVGRPPLSEEPNFSWAIKSSVEDASILPEAGAQAAAEATKLLSFISPQTPAPPRPNPASGRGRRSDALDGAGILGEQPVGS